MMVVGKYSVGIVRIFVVIIVLFTISTPVFGRGESGERTVQVVGSALIKGKKIAVGRDQAVDNSLVSAVSRMVEEYLPEKTVINNFQLLNEKIFSDLNTYIRDYKVLTESVTDTHYRVLVRATVSSDRVSDTLTNLGILTEIKSYPRILFFLAEQNLNDPASRFWWGVEPRHMRTIVEPAMAKLLESKGFKVLSYEGALPLDLPVDIDDKDAVEIGKKMGADVVVIGTADVAVVPNAIGGDGRSYNGAIKIRAVTVGSMQQFADIRRVTITSGADELAGTTAALEEVATLAAEELSGKTIKVWTQERTRPKYINVIVEGTGGHIAEFVKFRGALSDIPGVKGLQLSEMMPDAGVIQVDYRGTAKALGRALKKKAFVTFGIDIYEINPSSLRIRLIKD